MERGSFDLRGFSSYDLGMGLPVTNQDVSEAGSRGEICTRERRTARRQVLSSTKCKLEKRLSPRARVSMSAATLRPGTEANEC